MEMRIANRSTIDGVTILAFSIAIFSLSVLNFPSWYKYATRIASVVYAIGGLLIIAGKIRIRNDELKKHEKIKKK